MRVHKLVLGLSASADCCAAGTCKQALALDLRVWGLAAAVVVARRIRSLLKTHDVCVAGACCGSVGSSKAMEDERRGAGREAEARVGAFADHGA